MNTENKKKKKVKATELKNVRVAFVSYVKDGANGLTYDIIKEKNNGIIESECYTDIINKVEKYNCECIECGHELKSDKHCKELDCPKCGGTMRRKERPGPGQKKEKQSKKTFKEMLINLNPFKKTENDLDEQDKIFIKEVGGMSIAKKIQETLDSINKRVGALENNRENVSTSIVELKKELEGKEGTEKETLENEIALKEKLSTVQNTIANYEIQLSKLDQKIEESEDEDSIDTLKSSKLDKEILIGMLKGQEKDIQKELNEFEKSGKENKETEKGNDKDKEEKGMEKLANSLTDVAKRLETIENKRQESNKLSFEIDKSEFQNEEMDPKKEAFWKGSPFAE